MANESDLHQVSVLVFTTVELAKSMEYYECDTEFQLVFIGIISLKNRVAIFLIFLAVFLFPEFIFIR